jgi:hypothetical protein
MKRVAMASLALFTVLMPGVARGQNPPSGDIQEQVYRDRRAQLVKELQQAQSELARVRGERVQLESRIENVIATMAQQRARTLLLSNEANALQQIDAILTSSQDALLAQRDRFLSISDAVARRSGAMLVVLLRADSTQAQTLGSAQLTVDNTPAESRQYTVTANNALQMGAVDQLYRVSVLPTAHTVSLQVTVNGQTLTQTVNVNAAGESVTYVQFAVRNGQLIPTTWTSRGTTPF